jgi:hypothetical protein
MLFPMVLFAVISAGLVIIGLRKSSPPQSQNDRQMKLFGPGRSQHH